MRGIVAKRLRKEAAKQVTVKATLEGRRHTKMEFDHLLKYKKRNHHRTIVEPKLKLSRRQDRDLKWDVAMPARRYQDRLLTRHAFATRMRRKRKP